MILLTTTASYLQVNVGTGVSTIDVQVSFIDLNAGTGTPGYQNTAITGSGTTSVTPTIAASTQRAIKFVSIQNGSAASTKITVIHTDGTTPVNIFVYTLQAGECIYFAEGKGWYAIDANGNEKTTTTVSTTAFVFGETVSGSGTSWTLARTPSAGQTPLIAWMSPGFAGIVLIKGQTPGFTISGASITTTSSYSAGSIFAWYC